METNIFDKKILAGILKRIRLIKGFTQIEIAEKLGIKQSSYQRIEAGETSIDTERLKKICEIFGIEANQLFDFYKEEHESNFFNRFSENMDANFRIQITNAILFYGENAAYINAQDFLLDLVFAVKSDGSNIDSIVEKYKKKIELMGKML